GEKAEQLIAEVVRDLNGVDVKLEGRRRHEPGRITGCTVLDVGQWGVVAKELVEGDPGLEHVGAGQHNVRDGAGRPEVFPAAVHITQRPNRAGELCTRVNRIDRSERVAAALGD